MEAPERSEGGGWSELEQRFFEDAPPDVPVQPPAAPSFEDLVTAEPARRRGTRRASDRRRTPSGVRLRATALRARRWTKAALAREWRSTRATVSRAWRWILAAARREWRSGAATRLAAREAATRGLRGFVARLLDELPSERPDGKTMLAAAAALVVVLGLSASVLGSRGTWLAFRAPNADAATQTHVGGPSASAASPSSAETPAPAARISP